MLKKELQDLVLLLMGFDSSERPTDERIVTYVADAIRGEAISAYVKANGESSLELFTVPTVLPVKKDPVRNLYFSSLPFQILGLKDRNGIISVGKVQDFNNDFVPIQGGMSSVYSGLEAGGAAGFITYSVEAGNLYYYNMPGGITNVLLKSIPEFSSLPDDVLLPQPADFNALLITGARMWMQEQKMTPPDQVDDNNYESPRNG